MSFKLALQMIGTFLQEGVLSLENTNAYDRFQWAIVSKKIGAQKQPSEPEGQATAETLPTPTKTTSSLSSGGRVNCLNLAALKLWLTSISSA